jgi:two-component system, chemotaxis family, sensor kinase CheA
MAKNLADIQRELLVTFFEESMEGIEQLEAGLLSLEGSEGVDADVVNDVFRAAHSIKGGAGSFGLNEVCSLAHAMESLLEDFRSGVREPTRESLGALLSGVDLLRRSLDARRKGGETSAAEIDAQCRQLSALRQEEPLSSPSSRATAPAPKHFGGLLVDFAPLPQLLETGNEPVRLLRELRALGDARVEVDDSKLPRLADIDAASCYLSWRIELLGSVDPKAVEEVFAWVDTDAKLEIRPLAGPSSPDVEVLVIPADADLRPPQLALKAEATQPLTPVDAKPTTATEARVDAAPLGSIRVGVDKIDLLMNMVGELVITQSMLGVIDHDTELDAKRIEQLREGLSLLARNTRSLQESVMRLRSVPINVVFSRFPRLVHDLAGQLGKQVELKVSGQGTEIDKTVVEKLGDPLVHLIRNSMDHGLEGPEARRAAGKPEVGAIELSAYHHGGEVVVAVSDDGRGIDREKVLKKARELGLLGADETPPEDAIRDLIFAPGFSTAHQVTDVSGRGVGMDVVRRNIKALGGEVFVDTTPGKGTRISMRLPLTLAIIDGQLLRVGTHSYVLPLLSIVESVMVDPRRVTRYQGKRELYRLRDRLIPLVETGRLLGLSDWKRGDESLMVIVETEGDQVGLLVDELLAQQQVVVKSLETNYDRVEGLSGATILGDGSVAFILDTAAIGRLVRNSGETSPRSVNAA